MSPANPDDRSDQADNFDRTDRVLVIIPTFNERENLPIILDRVRAAVPSVSILVVDDSSPDGTGDIADERAGADDMIAVLHRTEKNGLGPAYFAGFDWGLRHGFDVLVEMDADGSHAPEQLPRLLGALDHADLVIGSRYVKGGSVVNWPLRRLVLSRGANLYSRLALGVGVKDITAGYRAYRAKVIRAIPLKEVASHGYVFQVDLAWRAILGGFRAVEVPITFTEREIGVSKMSGSIVREALLKITLWGAVHRWHQVKGLVTGKKEIVRS
ncbi:dolichol-phosphate mannosyltransferase [Nakamurella sp. UYEF19]|uniref:polyprenol monophosphomannose synthase n=1 Tax=Nakamurella sp. UYEF19 TaxID=1756392 RepID=UPI0033953272